MRRDYNTSGLFQSSFTGSEFLEKQVSVVDCIQDAKAAEMALLYLYGVVCKGKRVDGGMFPVNPFSNSNTNCYFENIMRKLGEMEKEKGK